MLRRAVTSSWIAAAFTALAVTLLLDRYGISALTTLQLVGYLTLAVSLPGVLAWRFLLRSLHRDRADAPTWFEDLTLGTALGFGVQLPFYLAGVVVGFPWLALAPAVAAVLVSLTAAGRRVWSLPTRALDPRAAWFLSVVTLYGMVWLAWNAFSRRPLGVPPHRTGNLDESFHHALVAELTHRFPPEVPHLLGTRLDYHWFVHAQMATMRSVAGMEIPAMLRVLLPTVALVLTVAGLAAVAHRLTDRPFAAALAPALLLAGAFHLMGPDYGSDTFTEPFLSVRYTWSPSQAYGVALSMPAVMLLLEVMRPGRRTGRLAWVALGLSLLTLAGAKATFLPVFLCGAIGAWGVHLLVHRAVSRTLSAVVGLVLGATLFAQLVLFGGQTGGLTLWPLETVRFGLGNQDLPITPQTTAALTAAMLVGWLLYGAGAVGLLRHRPRLDPRVVWLVVSVAAGITVPLVLYRSGLSQLWFQRSVAELVVLASVWGLTYLLPRPLTVRRAAALVAVATVSGVAAYALSARIADRTGSGAATSVAGIVLTTVVPVALVGGFLAVRLVTRLLGRPGRPPLAFLVAALLGLSLVNVVDTAQLVRTEPMKRSPRASELFAPGGAEAAWYVRDSSGVDEVIATNVHCREPDEGRCDNRNFWLAAHSERRIVVQGWGYNSVTNAQHQRDTRGPFLPMPYPERLETNDAAFLEPSEETLSRLVAEYDVDWLVASKLYPVDLRGLQELAASSDLLTRRFGNANYVVYEVTG